MDHERDSFLSTRQRYLFCVLKVICLCCSLGCATSEDLYWKLEALTQFVRDLHWPEEEFAADLENQMTKLTTEMIGRCAEG